MTLKSDIERTKKVASDLILAYHTSEFFTRLKKPDYSPPSGVSIGSVEHIVFLTLTLSIDPLGDTPEIWDASRDAYDDERTRYLFSPDALCDESSELIIRDLKKAGVSVRQKNDADNWRNVGVSISRRWGGDPGNFIISHHGNARKILDYMRADQFGERNDFPQIIGEKKGTLWISLLKDYAGYDLFCNLDKIPLKADIHIIRSSIALGLVSGKYSGQLQVISRLIGELWRDAFEDYETEGKNITALDVSAPLLNLSKSGCNKRDGKRVICPEYKECPLNSYCINGLFSIGLDGVIMDTNTEL